MTQHFLDGDTPGRSTLRRGMLQHQARKRPWGKRYAIAAGIVGFVLLIIYLIQYRVLPSTGPLSALYWLHDILWLTLRGHLWTAIFPYSLVWLVPVAGFGALAAIEWLSPMSTVGLQRRATLLWFRMWPGARTTLPPPDPTLLHHPVADGTFAPPPERKVPFRCQVARDEWVALSQDLRRASVSGLDPRPGIGRRTMRMAVLWARLDPVDSRALLAVIETLALLDDREASEFSQAVHDALNTSLQSENTDPPRYLLLMQRLARARKPDEPLPLDELIGDIPSNFAPVLRSQGLLDVLTLATAIVAMGWAARHAETDRLSRIASQWFDDIATRRTAAGLIYDRSEIAVIDSAMSLVDHPFWAMLAERRTQSRPKGPWLSAFGGYPDGAESFADRGVLE